MKLKGDYSAEATYNVGDVVLFTNGNVYHLQKDAPTGTPPTDTMYWSLCEQTLSECAKMIMDIDKANDTSGSQHKLANNLTTTAAGKGLDARQGKALKELIDALTERVAALEPEETTPDADNNGGGEGT